MANEPSQYPGRVSSGGLRHTGLNSLRYGLLWPAGADVRQPDNKNPPVCGNPAGLGSGGGCGIVNNGSDADSTQGIIRCLAGVGAATTITIPLSFPQAITAGQYAFMLNGDIGTIAAGTPSGGSILLTITCPAPPTPGQWFYIAYQWATSQ